MDSVDSVRLLKTRKYGVFWFSSLLSNVGTWMQLVAEPWLVLSISGSAFLLGVDAFAMDAPFWVLILLGGFLADKKDRRLVIYFFQGIQMLCPIIIVALILAGWIKVWMIIALSFVVGITDALSMPSFQSIIPSIVAPGDLGQAVALNSIQFNLSRILGPVLAGLVMVKYGAVWCFSANALSYIPFFFAVYWMLPLLKKRPDSGAVEAHQMNPVAHIKKVVGDSGMGWMLASIFCTSFFCSPVITFIPVLVKNVMHADVGQFGNALTSIGIGGVLGAIFTFLMARRANIIKQSLCAALLSGAVIALISVAPALWQLRVLLVAGGFILTVANISASTLLQVQTQNETRGQTTSLFMLALRGGLSFGNLITGLFVSFAGVQHTLMVNGLLAIAVQIFIFSRIRHNKGQFFTKTGLS